MDKKWLDSCFRLHCDFYVCSRPHRMHLNWGMPPDQCPGRFYNKKSGVVRCAHICKGIKMGLLTLHVCLWDLCREIACMPEGQGNLIPWYFLAGLGRARMNDKWAVKVEVLSATHTHTITVSVVTVTGWMIEKKDNKIPNGNFPKSSCPMYDETSFHFYLKNHHRVHLH